MSRRDDPPIDQRSGMPVSGPVTAQIPADLVAYLAARDQERSDRVDQAIAALTPREHALIREAAVMGYVQGVLSSGGAVSGAQIPPDSAVVRRVVDACQALPDLYPHLGGGEAGPTGPAFSA